MNPLKDAIWRFVAQRTSTRDFEAWVYDTPTLEELLGRDSYLELISTRFRDAQDVERIRADLYRWLEGQSYPVCDCTLWRDSECFDLGFDKTSDWYQGEFSVLRERTPWIHLARCKLCEQFWLVAVDTVDDGWYFVRLSSDVAQRVLDQDEWPSTFDGLKNCWPDA